MRIETGDALLALVAGCEEWRGRAVGALPAALAPDDAAVWFRVLTVAQAEALIAEQMIEQGKDYTASHGLANILRASVEVDLVDWTREEYGEDDMRLLWGCVADVLEFGDPVMMGSVTFDLLTSALRAGGLAIGEPEKPATSAKDLFWRVKGRGRWLTLECLDGAPEVYVTRVTERHVAAADAVADASVVAGENASNNARFTRSLLSHVLLSGPGGAPLLTMEQVGELPFGLARAIELTASALAMADQRDVRVTTFRRGQPVAPVDAGEAKPDLVVLGEDAPGAV